MLARLLSFYFEGSKLVWMSENCISQRNVKTKSCSPKLIILYEDQLLMIFIIKIVFESPILADFKDQAWFLFTKYNFCKYLTNYDPTKLKLNNLTDTALVHMATIYSWMPITHIVLKFFMKKEFYFSAPAFFWFFPT